MTLEHAIHFDVVETKSEGSNADSGRIKGYAATFVRDRENDRFCPSCWGESLHDAKSKVPLFYEHDRTKRIGITTHLAEDHKGLLMDAQLHMSTLAGREAWGMLKDTQAAGGKFGLSVGFVPDEVEVDEATRTRLIKKATLWEVSLVSFPAGIGTGAEAEKSLRASAVNGAIRDLLRSWRLF